MSHRTRTLVAFAVLSVPSALGALSTLSALSVAWAGAPARGCDPGRSLRELVGPAETLTRLRAAAERADPSVFFDRGQFDLERLIYLGRATGSGAYQAAALEVTWGQACRMTKRLLIFDARGGYVGYYGGFDESPSRLEGTVVLFPFKADLGDRIDLAGGPPKEVRVGGRSFTLEPAPR